MVKYRISGESGYDRIFHTSVTFVRVDPPRSRRSLRSYSFIPQILFLGPPPPTPSTQARRALTQSAQRPTGPTGPAFFFFFGPYVRQSMAWKRTEIVTREDAGKSDVPLSPNPYETGGTCLPSPMIVRPCIFSSKKEYETTMWASSATRSGLIRAKGSQ